MSEIINDTDLGDEIEVPEEITLKEGEEGYDKIDWKANAEKNRGIAQRNKTRAEKARKAADDAKAAGNKGKKDDEVELDKGDRAILRSEKITDTEEIALVTRIMKETGKDLEATLDSKYFQAELKDLRAEHEADAASANGSKRNGSSAKSTVEYWVDRDDLPPIGDPLRIKVVNARIAKKQSGSQFSTTPIS